MIQEDFPLIVEQRGDTNGKGEEIREMKAVTIIGARWALGPSADLVHGDERVSVVASGPPARAS